MSIIETLNQNLKNKKITSEELVQKSILEAKRTNDKYNTFVTILDNPNNEIKSASILSGIPYAAKDNFSTKDILSTGSSNTLKDYVPYFDATAIQKLKLTGAVLMGKTTLDELGMGGLGITAHTGVVKNPWDKNRIAGGSSAGSAVAVALGIVPFALGSDTGDSIRKPAAYNGIVGYKPTYGLVSRYGLFPFASSLDHVGVLTRSVKDAAYVIDAIKGQDDFDMTAWDSANISLINNIDKDIKGKKLFFIKELCEYQNYETNDKELAEILNNFKKNIEKIKELGLTIEEVSLDINLLIALRPTYDCISSAEATSNYSNLTGLIFGPRGEGLTTEAMMRDYRTKNFSSLIKRRLVIGSYVLQKENQNKYFLNACRVRKIIVEKFTKLFEEYDGFIMPCSGGIAPLFEEIDKKNSKIFNALENYLLTGNFGGFPSVTLPNGFNKNMPTGINITGRIKDDANILNIAYKIEELLGFMGQTAKEVE